MIPLFALVIFSSVDEAALAALKDAKSCSTHHECGGVIYKIDGGYAYSAPITSHNANGVDLWPAYSANTGIVADYHTHPCVGNKPLNNAFSPNDVAVNRGFNVAGYMLSLCDGYVRRWAPGDDVDDIEVDFHSGRVMYLTAGHIVGML